ncbi:uncharacterized protein [Dysidea avara]|uniref:uncharacterized protein n=1 Tax=Dysidea avara TaxID=196820 RepID=UPI0033258DBC
MEGSSLSEDMTVTDVVSWLSCQGFKDDIQQCFEAQEIDGEALFGAVGCQVGLDCLKDILPKFGQPIKVYRAIKAEMEKTNLQQDKRGESTISSLPGSSSRETSILSCDSSPGSPTSSVASQHSKVFLRQSVLSSIVLCYSHQCSQLQ